MNPIIFQYNFYAVGQGLFSSGHLRELEGDRQFHWVFDCGTLSRLDYVRREITQFKKLIKDNPIGLFCISHFDKDHINGARDLLSQHRVEVLVMPYFPLVERIRIALGTPGLSDDYLRFLVDPAGYMYAAAGDNLGEVIMIAGGGEPSQGSEGGSSTNPSENSDIRWDFREPATNNAEQPADEDIHGVSDSSSCRAVRVLGHQQPFTVGGAWEFLFFNEQIPGAEAAILRQEVADIIKKFRRDDGSFDGTGLLRDLKNLYAPHFGTSAIAKNSISLVAYSGPIDTTQILSSNFCGCLLPVCVEPRTWCDFCDCWPSAKERSKVSVGYFGDYPLIKLERVRDLRLHFGQRRWSLLQVVQIPHHGSSHSWYTGAAVEFQHYASVISSERCSKKFPSQSVLDDLSTHGILLVNEMQRAVFCGIV